MKKVIGRALSNAGQWLIEAGEVLSDECRLSSRSSLRDATADDTKQSCGAGCASLSSTYKTDRDVCSPFHVHRPVTSNKCRACGWRNDCPSASNECQSPMDEQRIARARTEARKVMDGSPSANNACDRALYHVESALNTAQVTLEQSASSLTSEQCSELVRKCRAVRATGASLAEIVSREQRQ